MSENENKLQHASLYTLPEKTLGAFQHLHAQVLGF